MTLLLALLTNPALAVLPDEMLADPQLEARARGLSTELRCLVCQNQSIDDSDAPLARDLRLVLRERLSAGDSDDQAVAYIVARYGEYVLLRPAFSPRNWLLWGGPFVLLAVAAVAVWRRRRPVSEAERELTAEEQAAVERLSRIQP